MDVVRVLINKARNAFCGIYDSPADFAKCLIITITIMVVWGLIMGLVGEYR